MGLEEFTCEKCGQKLKPKGKHAATAAHTPTPRVAPAPSVAPTPISRETNNKNTAIALGVLVLAAIGLFMATFTSVSLLSGSGTLWVGVAITAISTALAFFFGAAIGVRVVAAVCLAIALANTLYMEHQLDQKRNEISKVFHNGP